MNLIIPNRVYVPKNMGDDGEMGESYKIIGIDPTNDQMWLTSCGKKISEYDLLENYHRVERDIDISKRKKLPPSIFVGLGGEPKTTTQDEPIQEVQEVQQQAKTYQPVIAPLPHIVPPQPYVPATTQQLYGENGFDPSLIEKVSVDFLNKKEIARSGVAKYETKIVDVSVQVKIDYDPEKLISTIELLDISEDKVISYIVNKLSIDSLLESVKKTIKGVLRGEVVTTSDPSKAIGQLHNELMNEKAKSMTLQNKLYETDNTKKDVMLALQDANDMIANLKEEIELLKQQKPIVDNEIHTEKNEIIEQSLNNTSTNKPSIDVDKESSEISKWINDFTTNKNG